MIVVVLRVLRGRDLYTDKYFHATPQCEKITSRRFRRARYWRKWQLGAHFAL